MKNEIERGTIDYTDNADEHRVSSQVEKLALKQSLAVAAD